MDHGDPQQIPEAVVEVLEGFISIFCPQYPLAKCADTLNSGMLSCAIDHSDRSLSEQGEGGSKLKSISIKNISIETGTYTSCF